MEMMEQLLCMGDILGLWPSAHIIERRSMGGAGQCGNNFSGAPFVVGGESECDSSDKGST